ncbi:GntR family transcriptional regulator [Lederbergia sp. NSJ-179]|uniref:GntR family transcriptional regulator n=1 Tax=Lederbergia sp. NSJ-179 TaxID=2931402 RepID=UPI001FCFEF9F|nr:GntR family transcriptional regulator [Lederbergia sp. NSJ-179]MCJ7842975.1 GntR family transcriptional regulator [Lederbergia sp. NSJ-179]
MSSPKYKQIYTDLLEKIKNGEFGYGARVPSEKELAEAFNVSRITSKKALDMLAEQKVIERVRGKGSFVATPISSITAEDLALLNDEWGGREIKMIGLIIPDFSPDFGMTFVKSVEKICSDLNIHLMIKRTYGLIEEEAKCITSMTELGVDGLIIIPVHGQHYNHSLLQIVVDDFPFVLVDRFLIGIPASSVGTDNHLASKKLTEYLIRLGHEQIGFISSSLDGTSTLEERLKGFQTAFSHQGLKLDPNHIMTQIRSSLPASKRQSKLESIFQEDMEQLGIFIGQHPEITAFVASEYEQALMIELVLKKLGKKVPEDCSIVCFDHPNGLIVEKRFTHIKQKEELMAEKSIDLLLSKFNGESELHHLFLEFELVEGSSSSAIKTINSLKAVYKGRA